MKQDSNDKFLDIEEKQQKINMEKASRDKIIRKIKSIEGVTQRQLARVTGINQSLVFKHRSKGTVPMLKFGYYKK